jgi:hypothetical protein
MVGSDTPARSAICAMVVASIPLRENRYLPASRIWARVRLAPSTRRSE